MIEHAFDIILIGISIIFLAWLISIGVKLRDQTADASSQFSAQIEQTSSAMSMSELTSYNGLQVTGSDVTAAIQKFKDKGITIRVTTKIKRITDGNSTVVTDVTDYTNMQITESNAANYSNPTSTLPAIADDNYINPAAAFVGSVSSLSNLNDATSTDRGFITALIFEQVVELAVAEPVSPGAGNSGSGSSDSSGTGSGTVNGGVTISGAESFVSAVNQMTTALTQLQSTLDSIRTPSTDGSSSDSSAQGVAASLTRIMSTLSAMNSKLSNADFESLATDIDSLQSNTSELNTAISNLQAAINSSNSAITTSDVAELKQGLADISNAVAKLPTVDYGKTLNQIANTVGVGQSSESIAEQLDDIDARLSTIEGYIGKPGKESDSTIFGLLKKGLSQ